ncbi:recombinase family protein [Pseudarthrobacter sp. S9]|uniref:recombinase family protein n=1 Tax=Pseudarthrobacter sp. S9 TaxID=3418421 RepID=UPI003CFCE625
MTNARAPRAAIYARISRDQKGEGLGVERQEALCRALAEKLAADVVGVYEDNDISAYSGRTRPRYEQMLADIQQGQIDMVLCYHSDRLMRRTKELERYIDVCRPRNVVTHQVTAGLLDLSTATGLAVAKTVAAWNQHESDHKGERIAAQKAHAAQQGKYLGGRVPFGWKKEDAKEDTHGRMRGGIVVIDEPAAALIREGTAAIIAGRSLATVTRAWADAGAVNSAGTRRNTTEVRRTLLRTRNAGLMTFHGEVVSDKWPAIVPLDQFRKCEAILTDDSRPKQSESKFKYLLSGVAQCYCGRTMTGFGVAAKRAYRCKVHQEGGRFVPGHAHRAMQPLDDFVKAKAAAWLNRDDVKAGLREMFDAQDAVQPVNSEDISDLIDRKHSLARLFAQGSITESQLVEGSKEVESKLARLEDQAVANGGSRGVAAAVLSENPGAAFLGADVEVQREILRTLFTIELQRTGPYRGVFDESSVKMRPKG